MDASLAVWAFTGMQAFKGDLRVVVWMNGSTEVAAYLVDVLLVGQPWAVLLDIVRICCLMWRGTCFVQ